MHLSASYMRAVERAVERARQWKANHPDARLRFNPRSWLPSKAIAVIKEHEARGERALITGDLYLAISGGVAGNSVTRKFLEYLDRDSDLSVLQAEVAIEMVFGIPHALTHYEES